MDQFGSSGRSGHDVDEGAKVEKRSSESSAGDDEDRCDQQENIIAVAQESPMSTGIARSSPEKVDELENAKAEMGGVMQENQRLKTHLNQILNDYRTLQVQFHNIVEQDTKSTSPNEEISMMEESELVSLSLGRFPRSSEKAKVISNKPLKNEGEINNKEAGLALGLDYKFETSKSGNTNSSELPKEEALETWPPSKVINKTSITIAGEDEVSQQSNIHHAKKARVCVRARCDTLTMNDGCQWRKYGQKISKGNPCPRAYYRCTVATSCPVRKQVQRCAQDMSILITTYEGNHNHPLPNSATAMASTTSAAASMLLSGSSTSHAGSIPSANTNLHGMNFYLPDGSKSKQLYLSHPALSHSPSHPTITLDLTANNPASSSSSSLPFGRFATSTNFNNPLRYASSTSLNFSSSESNAMSWSNGLLSYNNTFQPYNNKNLMISNMNLERQQSLENNILNSYLQKNNNNNNIPTPPTPQHSLPDTLAAATKAITADPSFQSALAAALTSIIGTGTGNQNVGEIFGTKRKWGELFAPSSSTLPFSMPKSASASPDDNRD